VSIGSRSFFDNYYQLFRFLEKQKFADRIKLVDKQDVVATGRFEVIIKETKETIHSENSMSDKTKQAIADKIEEALLKFDKERAAAVAQAS
jgi:23S rRNA G2445 N2-methylase RlmL